MSIAEAPVREREYRPLPRLAPARAMPLPADTRPCDALLPAPELAGSVPECALPGIDREALFGEFQPLVRRLISQYGDDPELRQELPGEIFCRFCALLDAFDPGRGVPLRPYLVRCLTASVYTWARSHWRRRKREVDLEPGTEFADADTASDPSLLVDEATHRDEVLRSLPDAISRLPTRQRMVVVARYYEARSFEEISASLGIQPATARSLLRYGLGNLRRQLAGTGLLTE